MTSTSSPRRSPCDGRSDLAESHPELELCRAKDARNLVAHGYDVVDSEIVWSILVRNIPQVAARIEELLGCRGWAPSG
ncbi:DUF86 domain-containing protein [Ruania alkalisoli]|uniref:DUF86 domain-containing protein n=1 Tax=Ruania alkalisoli TaxID=2779775 RepID=A0A7M1SU45_9MICO|nr:HepT-like ribonuclease domain-containing protein [Ruania alkalisoli]QOR71109.1 DUF86 domain-containing protein [Ruania alkalisoli]